MPSTKKWSEIRTTRSKPGVEERVKIRRQKRAAQLSELRRTRFLTQETVASALDMTQPEVSKLEHRADVYVSTLRRYIEALGGELQIMARFPDEESQIIELHDEL